MAYGGFKINKWTPPRGSGGIPQVSTRFSLSMENEQADAGRLNLSRETKFSGTYGDRGIFIFPAQLTTSKIGNLTRFIYPLLYVMTIHRYIHTARFFSSLVVANDIALMSLLIIIPLMVVGKLTINNNTEHTFTLYNRLRFTDIWTRSQTQYRTSYNTTELYPQVHRVFREKSERI